MFTQVRGAFSLAESDGRGLGRRLGQRKVKAVFLGSLRFCPFIRPRSPAVQLRDEVVFSVREEMPIKVVGGPAVGVPHAAHYLEWVRALVDHERRGGVAELMKPEDIRPGGKLAFFSRGGPGARAEVVPP